MDSLSKMPLYKQLENLLISKIKEKELLPGAKLDSERELAKKYKINRQTVRKAIEELRKKGIVEIIPSSGTFVKNVRQTYGLSFPATASGIAETLSAEGIQVTSVVKSKGIIINNKYISKKVDLAPSQPIFGLKRLRLIKKQPFAMEYNFIPLNLFPNIEKINFENINLYEYMASQNKLPTLVDQKIEIFPASDRIANYLSISPHTPIYKIEYISLDKDNDIVEYTESYLIPEKTNIQFKINYL